MNYRQILSATMIVIFICMSLRHAWTVFFNLSPEALAFMASVSIGQVEVRGMVFVGIIAALMLVFQKTFKVGNIIHILMTSYIGYLLYTAGQTNGALIEIPIVASYLFLMYLGHPRAQSVPEKIITDLS